MFTIKLRVATADLCLVCLLLLYYYKISCSLKLDLFAFRPRTVSISKWFSFESMWQAYSHLKGSFQEVVDFWHFQNKCVRSSLVSWLKVHVPSSLIPIFCRNYWSLAAYVKL